MRPAPEPAEPQAVRLIDAALLGAVHSPTEMLPVSSSGHLTLIAWLADLPYATVSPDRRKSVEIALHAGTALGLAAFPPKEGCPGPHGRGGVRFRFAMLAPTAIAGLVARRAVRSNLGTPATTAAGLVAGSVAMLAAETQTGTRRAEAARAGDGLAMGVAQALALWPGVSRSAMSAVAARYLGFGRSDSMRLARTGLVTTSLAATTLEGISLSRGGVRTDDVPAMAAGAVAALATAVVARPLATHLERSGRLWPWALWRLALAAVAVRRLRIRSFGDDGE